MKQTIAIISQKGGVGKTTTAINAGAYLAKAGKSVLIVDFDPQANATSGLGLTKTKNSVTSYDVILNTAKLSDAVKETAVSKLYVLPASPALAATEVELASTSGRETKLKKALELAEYDFVLIDCPPSLGLLSINALVASDSLIIPVQTEYYALEGLAQLLDTIQRVRQSLNPKLELLGILSTMYDKRTNLSSQVSDELNNYFGEKVFNTVIPRNVKLAEAPSFGKPILQYDRWSKGAKAYKQLASEMIARIGSKSGK
jgi:chromosome partitioning protein